MPKRILIFSLAYYPHASGAEIAVKEITDRISSQDIEFHMMTLRFSLSDAPVERIGNILVHRVGSGGSYLSKVLFIPRAALAAVHLHQTRKFDAWWALMSYMVGPVVLLRLGGVVRPYVLTLQDGDPFEHVFDRPHIKPFKPLLQAGFKDATVVQVISNYLGGWARQIGYAGRVELVPNGVDIKKFSAAISGAEKEMIQKKLGKKEGEVWLVTTSRLVQKNAVDIVIRALTHLPAHIHFLIIGSGEEEQDLKRLAATLELSERVHFLGQKDQDDLPGLLHACDIFVRTSRTEGMGSSFVEAFAAGRPVVATQVGGIADFLFDAKRNPDKEPTGFAVDVDSPPDVARAVEEILGNPEATRRVIENAKALASATYDWDLIAKDMQAKVFGPVLT